MPEEAKVFRLAARRGDRITLSDIIIETKMGLKQAETYMDSLIDGAHVRINVNSQGIFFYEFTEIINQPDSKGG